MHAYAIIIANEWNVQNWKEVLYYELYVVKIAIKGGQCIQAQVMHVYLANTTKQEKHIRYFFPK
jgi:hypothetical protein